MEANIGNYRFVMVGNSSIHVFDDSNSRSDSPVATFNVTSEIVDTKEFQLEVMDWYSKNIS